MMFVRKKAARAPDERTVKGRKNRMRESKILIKDGLLHSSFSVISNNL